MIYTFIFEMKIPIKATRKINRILKHALQQKSIKILYMHCRKLNKNLKKIFYRSFKKNYKAFKNDN